MRAYRYCCRTWTDKQHVRHTLSEVRSLLATGVARCHQQCSAARIPPRFRALSTLARIGDAQARGLTAQLVEQDRELVPTPEQEALKQWITSTLKPLLERHSGGVLQFFGSCDNGFWMNGSDVDACLVIRRCTLRASWWTKLKLVQCLVQREQLGSAQVVKAARVPIAKVCDTLGADLCDVSINNVAALENSRFVGALAQLDPRVPSMGRFIKHWASRRRINNRSEGTLSTYTLILQLVFFLQTRHLPVLPRVVDMLTAEVSSSRALAEAEALQGASGADALPRAVARLLTGPEMDMTSGQLRPLPFLTEPEAIFRGMRGPSDERNQESIGELMHGFFQFYGSDEFRGGSEGGCQTVFVYDGQREANDLGVLVMRCPLTGKNVNPFIPAVWRAIHAEFERAAALLARGAGLAELCEPAEESPAGLGARSRA